MEEVFLAEFVEKTRAAEQDGQKITELAQQCANGLGALHPSSETGSQDQAASVASAFEEYKAALSRPVLRIAVFGATSSAKSTLLNFLIGANLLPTDVLEKSAGTVRIIHSPDPGLKIEDTSGRLWECGSFDLQSAGEIRSALEVVMDCYRNALLAGEELEAPEFIVRFPTNLPEILDLPEDMTLELMDLPGIKFTGDIRNRKVIASCQEALCLVTFGSQDTDPLKQEAVLDDVIAQVQSIGSPIGRMLFVATRVDEFLLRSADNWPANERLFMEDRLNAIKEKLNIIFPGQNTDSIELTSISPLPAFYSQLLYNPEARDETWKRIKRSFLGLVEGGKNGDPEQGIDMEVDLKPAYRMWDESDWNMIISQLEETTHAIDFMVALKSHIQKNFSSIILPLASASFVEESSNARDWLAGEAEFVRNAIERSFDEQKERLESVVDKLHEINDSTKKRLDDFLQAWLGIVFQANGADEKAKLKELAANYPEFMVEKLGLLSGWSERLHQAYLKPYNAVIDNIFKNAPLPQNLPDRPLINKFCASLRKNGYNGQAALNGINFLSADPGKRIKFSDMVRAYNNLCDACVKCAQKSIQEALLLHTDKILEALNELQDAWLAYLDREYAREIPGEFKQVARITPNSLRKFVEQISLEEPLRGSGARARETREEVRQIKETRAKANTGNQFLDSIVEFWWRLSGNDKIQEIIKKTQSKISIPPLRNLRLEAQKTIQAREKQLNGKMADFAEGQMKLFKDNIAAYQAMRIDAYRKRLDDLIQQETGLKNENEAKLEELDGLLDEMNATIKIVKNY